MKIRKWIFAIPLIAVLLPVAIAQIPADLAAPLQEHVNQAKGELEQKAIQHLQEGNLTPEHLSQDLNASKDELKQKAVQHLNQDLNITQQQLEERAKAEIQNQVNQKVQQPGFEAALAALGIMAGSYLFRRRS